MINENQQLTSSLFHFRSVTIQQCLNQEVGNVAGREIEGAAPETSNEGTEVAVVTRIARENALRLRGTTDVIDPQSVINHLETEINRSSDLKNATILAIVVVTAPRVVQKCIAAVQVPTKSAVAVQALIKSLDEAEAQI
jgi:hypothetical protein